LAEIREESVFLTPAINRRFTSCPLASTAAMPTQAQLDEAARSVCMPVTLLINFSLFQYLFTLYYKRRREFHGFLLLTSAFVGFVALVPFASRRRSLQTAGRLNDISETASTIMVLVQIVIDSRVVVRKTLLPGVRVVFVAAEVFSLLELAVLVLIMAELITPSINSHAVDRAYTIIQDVAVVFIFVSRFYFILKARGWKYMCEHKKFEMAAYMLFATHPYPFALLETKTGLVWEPVEAMWHRLSLALCLSRTIREKLRASSVMSQHKVVSAPHSGHQSTLAQERGRGPQLKTTTLSKTRVMPSLKRLSVTTPVLSSSPSVKAISTAQ